jgi:hypothetical protein
MRKNNNISIFTTVVGILAWLSLMTYHYCTKNQEFFTNHNSLYSKIGIKAIPVSIILTGMSA